MSKYLEIKQYTQKYFMVQRLSLKENKKVIIINTANVKK